MKWKEIKEAQGVIDETEIDYIDIGTCGIDVDYSPIGHAWVTSI